MKFSYKTIVCFSIAVNMIAGCDCESKTNKPSINKKKIRNGNFNSTLDDNDITQHNPENTSLHKESNSRFEEIWKEWLKQDAKSRYIKNNIREVIKEIVSSREEVYEIYTNFYKPQLNISSKDDTIKALVVQHAAYKQQLKDLIDQWSYWQKKAFTFLFSRQKEKNMPELLLLLATGDDKEKLVQIISDYRKKKEDLMINFIKNSEIVQKTSKEYQEKIPEGIKKYQEKIRQEIDRIQNDTKKDSEKTVDEKIEAIFDTIDPPETLAIYEIDGFIKGLPLSEEEKETIYAFYQELLNTKPIDQSMEALVELMNSHTKQLKACCLELPSERRRVFTLVCEKFELATEAQILLIAPDDLEKKLIEILIVHKEQCKQAVINEMQNPKSLEKMADTFKKALPEGIKKYEENVAKHIEILRKKLDVKAKTGS